MMCYKKQDVSVIVSVLLWLSPLYLDIIPFFIYHYKIRFEQFYKLVSTLIYVGRVPLF